MARFSPERLRELRLAAGVTITDLASNAGWSYNTVRSYEAGVRTPSTVVIAELADALGVSVVELFDQDTTAVA